MDSAAFVVLGMHRSGTSALARLLHDAGANVGERLVPGSSGNESGHWEDAFAVETDERLLAALGRHWDDVRPLPGGWQQSEAAGEAREGIARYVAGSRLRHRAWVVKDPRMCLVADAWLAALAQTSCATSAILLARHPQEVMDSLAARDGMAPARAALLWMRYMLEAERATRHLPRVVLTYDRLLADPLGALARIRALPGGATLQHGPGVASAVQPDSRHHQASASRLAAPLGDLWSAFVQAGESGELDVDRIDRASASLAAADRIYAPVLSDIAREREALWERTAKAEAAISSGALSSGIDLFEAGLAQVREGLASLDSRVFDAVGGELRRMQEEHAKVLATASELSAQVGMARDIAPGLAQVREGLSSLDARIAPGLAQVGEAMSSLDARMVEAVGGELRRMQEEHAKLLATASELSAQAGMARDIAPGLAQVREGLSSLDARIAPGLAQVSEAMSSLDARMVEAVGGELRRMQQEHARMLAEASTLSAEAAMARTLVPEIGRLHEECLAKAGALARLQAELAESQRQGRLLQADARLLRDVVASRSWRITRPLRVLGRMLRGEPLREGGPDLGRWWALQLAGTRFLPNALRARMLIKGRGSFRVESVPAESAGQLVESAPGPVLATQGDKPDVLVWAVIDWHFRTQRPQHIARGLAAAGHRVFYLSNNLVDAAAPGFEVEPLDDSGRLYQVFLHAAGAPSIYTASPSPQVQAQLRRSTGELLQWADSNGAMCIVQHPFWSGCASRVPGAMLLYDCMDHHAGFDNNAPDVLAAEAELTRASDLLVVTSDWLDQELAGANPNRVVIRNAGDFAHFSDPPAERYVDAQGRKVIGYIGAIAEWFDVELVRGLARAYPECLLLLVGSDTAGVAAQLADEPNVVFTGEVPYARLPFYLHAFDVALLPFRVIPLTLATNPVKIYEYLAAAKPVVAVDLPEMRQFGDLVHRPADQGAFIAAVGDALREQDPTLPGRRRAFAREQTWDHRARDLDTAIAALAEPMVSVVVLAYNNLEFTRACLHSLDTSSHWRNLEVIVVDNASTDGTREFLREWQAAAPGRVAILNDDNLGFAAGNNVGLAAARGDYLVLLNNDTYVTPHWVRTMVNHLARNPDIGILGPVTNNIGNEARIEIQYADMQEMQRAAAAHTRRHMGQLFDIGTAAFFCVAMTRSTYERVGPLDEAFGIGFFEDDDYCRRVQAAGLRVSCADDVFVHHHLSASFDALKAERRQELFERNKAIYESKWGPWVPHAYRNREA